MRAKLQILATMTVGGLTVGCPGLSSLLEASRRTLDLKAPQIDAPLTFERHGVRFSYPNDWSIQEQSDGSPGGRRYIGVDIPSSKSGIIHIEVLVRDDRTVDLDYQMNVDTEYFEGLVARNEWSHLDPVPPAYGSGYGPTLRLKAKQDEVLYRRISYADREGRRRIHTMSNGIYTDRMVFDKFAIPSPEGSWFCRFGIAPTSRPRFRRASTSCWTPCTSICARRSGRPERLHRPWAQSV